MEYVKLTRLGAALVIREGRLYYGPLNADGTMTWSEDEFHEMDPARAELDGWDIVTDTENLTIPGMEG